MQKDLDAMRSTLRSAGASGMPKPARRSDEPVGWHPTGHGAPERIDRAEVSALWDRPRHGYITRELTKEGMVEPRKPLPSTVVSGVPPVCSSVRHHVLA